MKLEPKAKPIKIRIMLGGEEHSSVEGLKRCFSFSELYPLIEDGRFDRWLDQIGERDKAVVIRERKKDWNKDLSEKTCKDIVCALFCESDEKDLLDIVKSWEKDMDMVLVSKEVLRVMSKTDFEAAKYFYIKFKDSDEPWHEIFANITELKVLKDLIEDKETKSIFDDKTWGDKIASFAKDTDSFKQIFEFLKVSGVGILEPFCHSNEQVEKISHNWLMGKGLDAIKSYYQEWQIRSVFRKYWSILFSEAVNNDKSFEDVLKWIQEQHDKELEENFILYCAKEKNIDKAKTLVDPWYMLAKNDNDYQFVKRILDEYNINWGSTAYLEKMNEVWEELNKLTCPMSYQIIDFLIQVKNMKGGGLWSESSIAKTPSNKHFFYPYNLDREKIILENAQCTKLKMISENLSHYEKEGCVLARKVIDKYNSSENYFGNKSYPGFLETQELMIEAYKEQLKKARNEYEGPL